VPVVTEAITNTGVESPKPLIKLGSVLEKRVVSDEVLVLAGTGIVIEVAALAGIVKNESSKIDARTGEILLAQVDLMIFSFLHRHR